MAPTVLSLRYDDRRVRFEPVGDRYRRIEESWTGCRWRHVGREFVADLALEADFAEL